MSDQATPQRDGDDDKDHDVDTEQSDQNGESEQPGAQPDHAQDRPTDPDPAQEAP